jgi:4-amino-4-deoxy-L-arabinose transferase-like glycosyltransferase
VSALILCTCHNVILMGRTASWDIYCHAFMLGAVYHLAVAIKGMGGKWRHCIVAGVLAGLSIMSKGPVSVYALLLPFVIAFAFVMRPCIKGCRVAIGVMCVIALVVGGWWFAYIHLSYPNELAAVVEKESEAWISYNVRPWYYYWKFRIGGVGRSADYGNCPACME